MYAIVDINNTLPDFNVTSLARVGLCVVYRKDFKATHKSHNFQTFECLELSLTSVRQDPLKLVTIYRPPPNSDNEFTSAKFFEEFSVLLESIDWTSGHFVVCGDFNIHMNNHDSPDAKTLTDKLDSCAITQHVHEAHTRKDIL